MSPAGDVGPRLPVPMQRWLSGALGHAKPEDESLSLGPGLLYLTSSGGREGYREGGVLTSAVFGCDGFRERLWHLFYPELRTGECPPWRKKLSDVRGLHHYPFGPLSCLCAFLWKKTQLHVSVKMHQVSRGRTAAMCRVLVKTRGGAPSSAPPAFLSSLCKPVLGVWM